MAMKHVAVGIDESPQSLGALTYATRKFLHPKDGRLALVCVLSPLTYPVTPSVPIATAGAVAAIAQTWEHQKAANEEYAKGLLDKAKAVALEYGVEPDHIRLHSLPAAGGASGVADSLIEYANIKKPDVMVIGSRGMGAFKRSLMSLAGLGSVSDAVVHNCHVPLVVYHPVKSSDQTFKGVEQVGAPASTASGGAAQTENGSGHKGMKVLIAVDDSDHSQDALTWTLEHVIGPDDEVHILSVAQPVAYPIVDETSAAVAAMESQEWEEARKRALQEAYTRCLAGVDTAVAKGVPRERLFFKNMLPEGGASDVGDSLLHYAKENKLDLIVVGSRGMGTFKRGLASFFGLGSVSDYCCHNATVPVLVYKK